MGAKVYLNRGSFNFRRTRRDRFAFVALYLLIIIGLLYFWYQVYTNRVLPVGQPTPTLTRSPDSYGAEAEKQFSAGQLNQAIGAYQKALEQDPKRIDYYIKLARIQVYADKASDAVETAKTAVYLDPNNSTAHAVYALALDWDGKVDDASVSATRAIQLDHNNALAYAYYAEILVDQSKWSQARDASQQALTLDPNSMDAYRTYGYYLESTGNYAEAITQYQSALKINPNLGFLYMQIGVNFRTLATKATTDEEQQQDYDLATQYFQRASGINPDSIDPLLSLSTTKYQEGQYGAASQYLEDALTIDPANAKIHGRLGLIYFKSLNYESSIIELGCAVKGCTTATDTVDDVEGAPVLTIAPVPLGKDTLEIYYTYSSVLAALSTPEKPYCPEDRQLFQKIASWLTANPGNEFVTGILDENESICQIADTNATQAALTGNITPSPTVTGTLTATPKPSRTPPGPKATATP